MTVFEERRVINSVLAGDRNAFADIVTDNQKNVYNLALRMMKNEQDALDVSQEAFIKAYTTLSSFKGQSRLSVWLYRITYNICIDTIRRRERESAVPIDDDGGISPEKLISDGRHDPETEYSKKELQKALEDALSSLSEDHREIFLMREYSDMSYSEIASALGTSEGTVKSRLSRARRAIAKYLTESGTIPEEIRLKSIEDVKKEVRTYE